MDRLLKRLENSKLFIWGLILLITIIWGYAWVVMKEALVYMGPYTFSFFRFLSGSAALFVVLWLSKQTFPIKPYRKQLMIQGLLQTTAVFLLVMFALQFVGAGKSSVLLYSMPIWGSLLAAKFLHEKLTAAGIIGLIFGLGGLLFMIGWDVFVATDKNIIIGQLLIVFAAVVWAASNVYFRLNLQHLPKTATSAWQMAFGTIGLLIAALLFEWGEPVQLNVYSIYLVLFSGVVASALCFTIWFLLLSLVDMMTATISSMFVPVFGIIFSSLLLKEPLTINLLFGSFAIITGIVISQMKGKKRSKAR